MTLRVLRMVAPGMFQRPAAVVVICIDQGRAVSFGMRPTAKGLYIDVGTAAQTMLLAAHSLGLGAGVVTSFSQAAVIEVLNIPGHLSPEMFVCLGYPAAVQPPGMRARGRVTWQSLTDWERFSTGDDAGRRSGSSTTADCIGEQLSGHRGRCFHPQDAMADSSVERRQHGRPRSRLGLRLP
jgi:hypothetical protein